MKSTTAMAWGTGLVVMGVVAVACLTSGCASVGYLSQSMRGHVQLMTSAKPVGEWLADDTTPAALKARLALSQRMRDFAVQELKLPDNASYRRYADLGRRAAVWNVAAAPELSLKLMTWCFPIVGCVGYRGYYDELAAQAYAQSLQAATPLAEVTVYPVPAYSTLGKLEWLGGDPLLNTFVHQHETGLAALMFHELAHQVAYAKDDTTFNESFATAVERIGLTRWQARHGSDESRAWVAQAERMRTDFRRMVQEARASLTAVYDSAASDEDKRSQKQAIYARLRAAHQQAKSQQWQGNTGYDAWFARANNATLGISGSYNDAVPAFERLFVELGEDFDRFYAEVQRLADLPKAQRSAIMKRLEQTALGATTTGR